jgi:folate-dependent phosphoribosylglycinamide formyltransferase PurN
MSDNRQYRSGWHPPLHCESKKIIVAAASPQIGPDAMTDLPEEAPINRHLEHDRPGRTFTAIEGSRWGEMILPSPDERSHRKCEGLRVLAVTSYNFGNVVLAALSDCERSRPGRFHLEALATDDAFNAKARLALHKRIWRFYSAAERMRTEIATVETALQAGLPVWTGEMKIDAFRQRLAVWNPDVIIICGCGQIFDAPLIEAPRLGVYNFHPADLAAGHGAGPQPYEDLLERNDPWTKWTLHRLILEVDAGPVICQSPPVFAGDAEGRVTRDPKRLFERMSEVVAPMVATLADALLAADRPLEHIDFGAGYPQALRAKIAKPLP